MTVSVTSRKQSYDGNGATTAFSAPFQFYEIAVYLGGVLQTDGTDYNVTGGDGATGTVTFTTAPPAGTLNVVFVGETSRAQGTDLTDNGPFPAGSVETMSDRLSMIAQEFDVLLGQTLRVPVFDTAVDAIDFEGNKDKILRSNPTTGAPELVTPDTALDGAVAATAASASAAATSATNAATSATNAATSATTASNAATSAQAAQTAAETAETNAETAETNAETAQAAAETAETNAASSASAASTSATNAASSASAASTSATNAGTSETNAASSASAASTSATNAASSASAAATSATNASTAQTAAETAQTAAETAQAASEAASLPNYTAKGDLASGGAAGWEILSVGTNDLVLVADSAEATGKKWGNIPIATVTGLQGALDGKATLGQDAGLNSQTANYTLVLADKGKVVEMDNAAARTITVPPNSSVAFPVGTRIDLLRLGAGTLTVVAGSGVTVSSVDSNLAIKGQYSMATLVKRATDNWILVGSLE